MENKAGLARGGIRTLAYRAPTDEAKEAQEAQARYQRFRAELDTGSREDARRAAADFEELKRLRRGGDEVAEVVHQLQLLSGLLKANSPSAPPSWLRPAGPVA